MHIINLILLTRLSERLNERTFVAILQPIWTLPCIIALRYWPGVFEDKWGTYALVMILLSYPYCRMFIIRSSPRSQLTIQMQSWLAGLPRIRTTSVRGLSPQLYIMYVTRGHPGQWALANIAELRWWLVTDLQQMSVQTGNICSSYIYREDDKPLYRRGNSTLLIINVTSILVFLFTKAYYVWRNKQKERIWNALTEEQQIQYIKTTKLQGSKRLDFRFAH